MRKVTNHCGNSDAAEVRSRCLSALSTGLRNSHRLHAHARSISISISGGNIFAPASLG